MMWGVKNIPCIAQPRFSLSQVKIPNNTDLWVFLWSKYDLCEMWFTASKLPNLLIELKPELHACSWC